MANFLFYRYNFVQGPSEASLFPVDSDEPLTNEFHNRRFKDDLQSKATTGTKKLTLYATIKERNGDTRTENYENEILNFYEGVCMLRVRNNKSKKFMPKDSEEAQKVGHYPYALVIIDTRPGSQAILVQQKKDAFENTDIVADLIVDYCTRELGLGMLGWEMNKERRTCKGTIWEVVKLRTFNDQDRVKSLCLKFESKRANEQNAVDIALQTILQNLAAPEGELKLTSDDDAKKLLDETKEDVRRTVDLLIENNYSMRIGFERSGTVEYGKKAPAIYGVADSVCEQFQQGAGKLFSGNGYDIFGWLDMLMPEDQSHEYVVVEKKKRNGRKVKK